MREWLCVQKLLLFLLSPHDSEVVANGWSPSQAAQGKDLLESQAPPLLRGVCMFCFG